MPGHGERGPDEVQSTLAAILESADEAIILKTLDGVISSYNPAAERLFGYTAGEAIGQAITLLVPDDRLDEEQTFLARIRRGERIEHQRTVRRRKDGRLIEVSLTIVPITNAVGVPVGAAKIARRVAPPARADELLRRTLQAAPIGTIVSDELGRIVFVNTEAERLLGYAAGELVGASIETLVPAPYRGTHPSDRAAFVADPRPRPMGAGRELHALRKDGRELPVEIGLNAIATEAGMFVLAVIVDITERKLVEEERRMHLAREQAAREAAEEANRAKDDFLAMLSHELRTPLTSVIGWTRILHGGGSSADVGRALAVIERNAALLGRLIDDLLDASRIITGKLTIAREPVDLRAVVEAAVDSARHEAEAAQLTIDAALSSALVVRGDRLRLQQVVNNLISNALKFTPAGGTIRVALERADGPAARLVVQDTGCGIDAPDLPQIFERFRQVGQPVVGHRSGLGLGLAIARHIVELHGGRVRAESQGRGKGTTLVVDLPLSPAP